MTLLSLEALAGYFTCDNSGMTRSSEVMTAAGVGLEPPTYLIELIINLL